MPIVMTKDHRQEAWASWHDNEEINRQQAHALALDALAQRKKLTDEVLKLKLGHVPSARHRAKYLSERTEPGKPVVWVCWRNEAIAVRTEPVSRVKDRRYYLTWYWQALVDLCRN